MAEITGQEIGRVEKEKGIVNNWTKEKTKKEPTIKIQC